MVLKHIRAIGVILVLEQHVIMNIVTIILHRMPLIQIVSNTTFLLLSRATSIVAQRSVAVRAATSGPLPGTITTPCTTWASLRLISTARTTAVATAATLLDVS